MRYAIKREDGSLIRDVGFNTKQEAESWIQVHLAIYGGLDWRTGSLFKARNDNPLEIVWAKSKKPVKWNLNLKTQKGEVMINYGKFINKEVVLISDGEIYQGIVADIDYDIGITIVMKDNPSTPLLCLQGPNSVQFKANVPKEKLEIEQKASRIMFQKITAQIAFGEVNADSLEKIYFKKTNRENIAFGNSFNSVTPEDCPFSQ